MYNFTDRWFNRVRTHNETCQDWPVKTHWLPFISEPDYEFMCGSHTVPEWYASPKEKQRIAILQRTKKKLDTMERENMEIALAHYEANKLWQEDYATD